MAHGSVVGAARSTAIVLFTDLVRSTELRSRLGEDAAEELRHQHDALVVSAVEASRGKLVKNLGDGIMATFVGASDAVGAAVAIQQAMARHNRSSSAALEVRIGISAGDVVFEGDDCFGTPVIEAARLCGAAAGGQILASEMVRWLARSSGGTFTPIGSLELKGLPEPVPVVQVDWEPLPQSSVPLPAFLTDIGRIFVGRDSELQRLGQLWKEATAGELRVALLAGEPGVGKTRLAAELARGVHDEGATVLAGRCDEDLGVPYQPFVEALRHFADHSPLLSGGMGRYGEELVRLVPELSERVPGLPAPLRSDPETERYRLFDAVAAWLAVASVEKPLLLVLDEAGLALAGAVYEETEGNPFFVREVLRHLAETGAVERREGGWTTRLSVEELGIPEGVREVVGRRLSRMSGDTHHALRIAAVVGAEFELGVVQAAGNLGEETLLGAVEEAAGARLVSEVSSTRFRFAHALVRATLYESLTAARKVMLHRKAAEAIEAIHAGALDDHLPALAHHWARASAPAAETGKAVDYATRAGDRALAQLAHDEAVAYYRQALELLELTEGGRDDDRRLELLISLGEAQRRVGDRAFRSTLLDAARLAQRRGDAQALARAALANSRGTFSALGVVDAERVEAIEAALMALGDGSPALRARLLAILALELLWSGDTNRPSALSDDALALARSHGEPSVLGPVLAMRAGTLWNPRWARERLDIAAELLSIAEVAGDPYLHFWALYRRTAAFLELGDTHEAEACRRAAEREADDLGQPHPRWAVMFFKVAAAVASGRLADAKNAAQEILTLGRDSGQPDAEPLYAVLLATIRYQQGRLGELETVLADTVGRLPAVPYFRALLALAYCELDRPTDARFVFTSLARGDLRSLLFDYLAGPTAALLAMLCAEVGDADGAAVLTEVIAPYASQVASHPLMWLGSFSHHLGLLATTLGQWSEAEAHFRTAASTHERLGAPAWLARTRLEWARMLLAGAEPGGGERAHDLLRQALGTARELGLANIERRAVELLSSE